MGISVSQVGALLGTLENAVGGKVGCREERSVSDFVSAHVP